MTCSRFYIYMLKSCLSRILSVIIFPEEMEVRQGAVYLSA